MKNYQILKNTQLLTYDKYQQCLQIITVTRSNIEMLGLESFRDPIKLRPIPKKEG